MTEIKFCATGLNEAVPQFVAILFNECRLLSIHFFEVPRTQVFYHKSDYIRPVAQEIGYLADVGAVEMKVADIGRNGKPCAAFDNEHIFIQGSNPRRQAIAFPGSAIIIQVEEEIFIPIAPGITTNGPGCILLLKLMQFFSQYCQLIHASNILVNDHQVFTLCFLKKSPDGLICIE